MWRLQSIIIDIISALPSPRTVPLSPSLLAQRGKQIPLLFDLFFVLRSCLIDLWGLGEGICGTSIERHASSRVLLFLCWQSLFSDLLLRKKKKKKTMQFSWLFLHHASNLSVHVPL